MDFLSYNSELCPCRMHNATFGFLCGYLEGCTSLCLIAKQSHDSADEALLSKLATADEALLSDLAA